ncbi:calcium-transporting ATPase [Aureococcus anophagefferens]|nr:calcium-transporting ATPase [Aureococcus anophagefferens]
MHLQHPKSIESVKIYRESPARKYGLFALCVVAYAASFYACSATSGVPYARALDEAKALDALSSEKLSAKAAAHAARNQRLKLQKLAGSIADQQEDDVGVEGEENEEKKKSKAASERAKAEAVLERAAKLARHTIESANRGENKTEEELAIEVFGEDWEPEAEEEEARSLPSKYLPSAGASTRAGPRSLAPVRSAKIGAGLVVEYQRQLYEYWGPDDGDDDEEVVYEEVSEGEEDEEEELIVVDERDEIVGLGRANGSLRRISPPLALPVDHYAGSSGLDARGVAAAEERYGRNVVEVKVFTSLLWLLDAYWQYVGFTLFSITFMEAGTVMQRMKTLKSLSGMSAKAAPVLCWRSKTWVEVGSDDLLPGDLISVARRTPPVGGPTDEELEGKSDKEREAVERKREAIKKRLARMVHVVPCDCVLVRGSAVTNEATLTGESTPQMKDAVVPDGSDRCLDMNGADRVSVLFSGTELVNATAGAAPKDAPNPPDGGAVAFVLRTGFASAQGELMQMIEFSQQNVSSDTRETLMALGVLLIFAIASAAYVFKRGLEKGDRTTHELLLRCVIIVTSVVPRQLPMQMALAVNTALMALMKAGVMAIEPYRVPFAGRVKYCLFDKTGTLTTDRLVPMGVVCLDAGGSDAAPRSPEPLRASTNAAAAVLAACHSLVAAEDGAKGTKAKLVGDPIELTALQALGWTYDARSGVAAPPTGLVKAAKKDTKAPAPATRRHKRLPEGAPPRRVTIRSRFHFSSALQRMSVVADVADDNGAVTTSTLVKGSPEAVAALLAPGAKPAWFDATYASLAEQGMRVLALASRPLRADERHGDMSRAELERDLDFAGFVAFECKTRADSRVVIEALTSSAHAVAMVTGDAPLTALRVARETTIAAAGDEALLLTPDDAALSGASWASAFKRGAAAAAAVGDGLEEADALAAKAAARDAAEAEVWTAVSLSAVVFSRMSPQGKARICRSLQKHHDGPCVLMCGDGGNDVGALKQADVGLALLAGYGDANTTGEGGYAAAGEKLAKAGGSASAESILNAQAEALQDAQQNSKEWIDEELQARAARGETGMGAQFGAVKAVALRLRREMAREVEVLNAKHGNAFDARDDDGDEKKAQSPLEAAQALLGGEGGGDDAEGKVPMIRPGDASVAAPFTSRAPSIRAVVDLIRQGRCTLLSSLQQQQIMVLESVISAYTLAALSLEGARSSERQMMASGWLLVVASLAFSYTSPIQEMAPQRPLGSLFHPSIVVSVAGQGLIHVLCMRMAVKLSTERMGDAALKAVVLFQKKARAGELAGDVDEDDLTAWFTSMWSTPFLPNLLNTAVFLVETSQMVAVLLVNYKGRPWMKGLLENHALFLSLFLSVAGVVVCAWNVFPYGNSLIHLAPFPDDDFRWTIVGLVLASLAGTFVWDRLCTALFAPHIFRAQLAEGRKTTFADVQPILATALKVAAGTTYSKANAKAEKDRKAAILKAADDGAGAGK